MDCIDFQFDDTSMSMWFSKYSLTFLWVFNHASGSPKGKQENRFRGRLTRSTPGWVCGLACGYSQISQDEALPRQGIEVRRNVQGGIRQRGGASSSALPLTPRRFTGKPALEDRPREPMSPNESNGMQWALGGLGPKFPQRIVSPLQDNFIGEIRGPSFLTEFDVISQ